MSHQRTLGGDATHIKIGAIGFGTMMLTWKPQLPSEAEAFACLDAALESGSNFWNFGTFYANDAPKDGMQNLKLLARYLKHHNPSAASKIVISVKGGFSPYYNLGNPSSQLESLREELKMANEALEGTKKIDIFEPSRRDTNLTTKQIIENLVTLKNEGLFEHIGLSEVNAQTIREAHAVHPIASVELEYNPFSLEVEKEGMLAACKELNIALIAYSPFSRGLFTGSIRSPDDIADGDFRKGLPRFSKEHFGENLKLTEAFHDIAKKQGFETAQLVMAWELAQYDKLIPIPGSTNPANVRSNAKAADVKLDQQTLDELRKLVDEVEAKVTGNRYMTGPDAHLLK